MAKLREYLEGNKLDLSMSDLTEVPVKDIAAIRKATVLDLSNNNLTSLPPSFCTLTHLVELDLSKNNLTELPESFGNLINLKRLDLYGNKLTHLPLSFCQLKALRWLDLKNNPLVPMLAEIAGPCGDMEQCQRCAKNIVATLTQAAIKVEEERKKLLQEKLREQEQIEQEYLLKKKELDAANPKKSKKKSKKNKLQKETQDDKESHSTATTGKNSAENISSKGSETRKVETQRSPSSSSFCRSFLRILSNFLFFCVSSLFVLFVCSILLAAYDRKLFLSIIEGFNFLSSDISAFVLYLAKHVESAAKHPTIKELKSQLTACMRSIIASILNIYKTICQEFPVYYDSIKNKFL